MISNSLHQSSLKTILRLAVILIFRRSRFVYFLFSLFYQVFSRDI